MATTDKSTGSTRTVKASEFKAKCLQLMDEVAQSGEEIVITKFGEPVAKLAPLREKPKTLFGIDRGRIEILGDIISPLYEDWEIEEFLDREARNIDSP
ncbi:MAG: type II toxin-antitoxin system prevent-host-death family antitoxin [Chloroflexota bacterium]|nr:type II toxin-antitoxin system prevent-host-death family antitoxin [Chloroflexota bacterium]